MNILYIHGFGSRFDPKSDKVSALSGIGEVFGSTYDWTRPLEETFADIADDIAEYNPDIIIGTSMGGWAAANIGSEYGIPFVSINPAINPAETLQRYVGRGIDWTGKHFSLSAETVAEYFPMRDDGYGLILLDEGDEVIDSKETINRYVDCLELVTYEGGSHRFDHMPDALTEIVNFYNRASATYGFADV